MQQTETNSPESAPADTRGFAYRGAFVSIGNVARIREVLGDGPVAEVRAAIAARLANFATGMGSGPVSVGDDCFLLWLTDPLDAAQDVLEDLLVLVGSSPIDAQAKTFVPQLNAGWTDLRSERPRNLTPDEAGYVLFVSASTPTYGPMWRGHGDRFLADMDIAASIHAACAQGRVQCGWQAVSGLYVKTQSPFWRAFARPEMPDAGTHLSDIEVFMPALERLGLTRILDRFVALRVLWRLIREPSLRLACRISALSVQNDHFWSQLMSLLAAHPGAARRFTIEISGQAPLPSLDTAQSFCDAIRKLGAHVALARFGSGPISLAGLRACQPRTLLLDENFVQHCRRDDKSAMATLRDLIRICSHLAEQIIVTGVDNERDYFNALGAGARWISGDFVSHVLTPPRTVIAQAPCETPPARPQSASGKDEYGFLAPCGVVENAAHARSERQVRGARYRANLAQVTASSHSSS